MQPDADAHSIFHRKNCIFYYYPNISEGTTSSAETNQKNPFYV